MTKKMFKEEYEYIEEIKKAQKNDPVQWAYQEGRQSMLVSWALDVLPIEDVKEVLNSEPKK